MKYNHIKNIPLVLLASFLSCQSSSNRREVNSQYDTNKTTIDSVSSNSNHSYNATDSIEAAPETINEEVAANVRKFLLKKLKADLAILQPSDRKFSFYAIDLNDDKKDEYFVSLPSRYFCGSGGCSFYLLNTDFSEHTYFTVTNTPIFRSSSITDGWHDLILQGERAADGSVLNFIHLKFAKSKGRYPSNPSIIQPMSIAPSGHDFIMWDSNFSRAKIFEF